MCGRQGTQNKGPIHVSRGGKPIGIGWAVGHPAERSSVKSTAPRQASSSKINCYWGFADAFAVRKVFKHGGNAMKLPRRKFLRLAAGAGRRRSSLARRCGTRLSEPAGKNPRRLPRWRRSRCRRSSDRRLAVTDQFFVAGPAPRTTSRPKI